MAKQCGPAFLECTWDELTFYKMDGKYYVRKKKPPHAGKSVDAC